MLKRDELADPTSCLNRAEDDEFVFVLLERDDSAADTIEWWANRRVALGLNAPTDPQIVNAINEAACIRDAKAKRPKGWYLCCLCGAIYQHRHGRSHCGTKDCTNKTVTPTAAPAGPAGVICCGGSS